MRRSLFLTIINPMKFFNSYGARLWPKRMSIFGDLQQFDVH
ncbi:hypothetical protein M899_0224 [Bacteriovorax sp. BSW11_IV]|nr:hypothetical protein M899_0224 [Bacteriovorax sp. BSW11_IV]